MQDGVHSAAGMSFAAAVGVVARAVLGSGASCSRPESRQLVMVLTSRRPLGGNRRTTKEGSSDLKFQNFSLSKNRSWLRVSSPPGQYQAIKEPLLDCEGNFAASLDGIKAHRDDEYEDPRLCVAERWRPVRVVQTRPIKEPEYADTRCFQAVMDAPFARDSAASVPADREAWMAHVRLEDVSKPTSQDARSHHGQGKAPHDAWRVYSFASGSSCTDHCVAVGDARMKRSQTPLPPPRPPTTLPKKYQPLPPEPESCFPLRHTFPEAQRRPRQINLKNLSASLQCRLGIPVPESSARPGFQVPTETLATLQQAPSHQGKPELSHLWPNQNTQEVPVAVTSSSVLTSNDSVQRRDHREGAQLCAPQRCPSPASRKDPESLLCYKNASWRRPSPARCEDKDAPRKEWYIGEYSRQAVEEALMKENRDGTFLVRDCSSKSRAEPYVLVVFYGNKVYNVKIRFLEKNQQFALGTGLRGDEKFDSVEDIIEHYRYFPIILIDGKDKSGFHRQQCYLTRPLPPGRLHPPW
ncbi:PREDICTED: cytokine-dependent hematopoietic cell linker [Condylura cristata]|uniref:cytokine-dependent hematopoietic cell linker n=1 Tax=Condylura cristata TaxID=143302 RepID=UPI00033463FA|nr:PREDICTED: cytokine-dependent hematopoietic cell linker [Condylura cristata]